MGTEKGLCDCSRSSAISATQEQYVPTIAKIRDAGAREGEVPAQIERQSRNLDDLHGAIDDLLERLDTALRPSEPSKLTGAVSVEMYSHIGQRLDSNNDSLERAVDRIRDVIARLEV